MRQAPKLGQNRQQTREPEAEGDQIEHIEAPPAPHGPLEPLAPSPEQVPRRVERLLELLGDLGLRRDLLAYGVAHLLQEAHRRAKVRDLGVEVKGVAGDRDGDRVSASSSVARGGSASACCWSRGEAVPAFVFISSSSFGVGIGVEVVEEKGKGKRKKENAALSARCRDERCFLSLFFLFLAVSFFRALSISSETRQHPYREGQPPP